MAKGKGQFIRIVLGKKTIILPKRELNKVFLP